MKSASGRKRRSRRPQVRPGAPESSSRSLVPVLIAYSDIPSARRAMARLTRLLQLSGSVLQPMLWRFDQLTAPRWREMAIHDACRARTVTLAVADELALDRAPELWLRAVFERMRGSSLNVIALIGADDVWTLNFEQCPQKPAREVRAEPPPAPARHVLPSTAPAAIGATG